MLRARTTFTDGSVVDHEWEEPDVPCRLLFDLDARAQLNIADIRFYSTDQEESS